jgi:hypothetical protein
MKALIYIDPQGVEHHCQFIRQGYISGLILVQSDKRPQPIMVPKALCKEVQPAKKVAQAIKS